MRLPTKQAVLVLCVAGALGACMDLTVPNTGNPDRERALANPGDVESLIASTWREYWTSHMNVAASYNPMPLIADVTSGTYANNGALEMSSEPRRRINNSTLGEFHTAGPLRDGWESWYSNISSTVDGLKAIEDEGLVIVTADPGEGALDHTHRARTWAKFWQGVSHAEIATLFDKGWVISEGTEIPEDLRLPLRPWQEVRDSAIAMIEEGIALAAEEDFITPATWVNKTPITNGELQRMGHSFIAHYMIVSARTPAEREAVDWDLVLTHLDNGITSDFAPTMESGILVSNHINRHQLTPTSTFSTRGDYYLIGPADTSGQYQTWFSKPINQRDKFLIATPDRRITAGPPTSHGTMFRYTGGSAEIMNEQRGLYHRSYYQWFASRTDPATVTGSGRASSGVWPLLSVKMMDLYRAEALFFNGDLQGAADIINVTRNAAGLPDVTVDGVPEAPGCVPQLAQRRREPTSPTDQPPGICGTLYDALIYERMIEFGNHTAYRGWMDSRGFGRLTEGTFLSLPIPARELITIGEPVYTFGGVGSDDGHTAQKCTRVMMSCIP